MRAKEGGHLVAMNPEISLFICDEKELNSLLVGVGVGSPYPWSGGRTKKKLRLGEFGVLVCEQPNSQSIRPISIIVNEEDQQRLYARFNQLRPDLSPLSSWLHVMTPTQHDRIGEPITVPDFQGFEAAWAGLSIAEAVLLSGRPYNKLKLSACLATQTFALARSVALWGRAEESSLESSFLKTQSAFRPSNSNYASIGSALEPIWNITLNASKMRNKSGYGRKIVHLIVTLDDIRSSGEVEGAEFYQEMQELGAPKDLKTFDEMSAEDRLKVFDQVITHIKDSGSDLEYRLQLSFVAGYIATIAAGGSASLSIAEAVADEFPEVLAFAYLIGGIGERRSWAGGFDGLGRLVARELQRSWNIADGPVCDVAASEVAVLVDRKLNDPLVHLRLKQSRIATISLDCGVNIQVPFSEFSEVSSEPAQDRKPSSRQNSDPLAALADALLPYFRERLSNERVPKGGRRSSSRTKQSELKL